MGVLTSMIIESHVRMTVSTGNATILKSTKSRHSDFTVQMQIKHKLQFECVPRHIEEFECLDLVDFEDVVC